MDNIQDIAQGMQEFKIEAISCTFPQEIIQEILLRLPVKSVIKCTSVCKTWRSMIINHDVVSSFEEVIWSWVPRSANRAAHAAASIGNRAMELQSWVDRPPLSLVGVLTSDGLPCPPLVASAIYLFHEERHYVPQSLDDVLEEVYSLHYDNKAFDEYPKIEFPIAPKQELYNPHLRVVGTCKGLICLADDIFRYGYDIFIWNPAIRKLVTLPYPGVTYMTHGGYDAPIGFGFDANTNDYKVVRLVTLLDMSDDRTTVAEVYSIATGALTSLDFVYPSCILRGRESQAFVNGTLHWPVLRRTDYGNEYFILTFDVSSKLFCEMPVPRSLIWDFKLELQLSVSGDGKSISLFLMDNKGEDRFLDILVIKEYGIKESWTKLITLGPQGPERLPPRAFYTFDNYHIKSKHELVSLDLVNKTVKNLGVPGEGYQYCSVHSFKEVLVLLDQTDAVSY
ncbi:PREDICTED: uncharacterized protein LOC103333053 [Prunus mume]|uniref:Uncharacterized protein LOC103333053 n=1 Tax=Prunus mume TaxID=102107 RepID=A0ABM1LQW2_PRUMU|nr:PREDICTED: uncharacterized protein LOC103333053 [Prunus mume]